MSETQGEPRAAFDTAATRFRVHRRWIDALGLKPFEGAGTDGDGDV